MMQSKFYQKELYTYHCICSSKDIFETSRRTMEIDFIEIYSPLHNRSHICAFTEVLKHAAELGISLCRGVN